MHGRMHRIGPEHSNKMPGWCGPSLHQDYLAQHNLRIGEFNYILHVPFLQMGYLPRCGQCFGDIVSSAGPESHTFSVPPFQLQLFAGIFRFSTCCSAVIEDSCVLAN